MPQNRKLPPTIHNTAAGRDPNGLPIAKIYVAPPALNSALPMPTRSVRNWFRGQDRTTTSLYSASALAALNPLSVPSRSCWAAEIDLETSCNVFSQSSRGRPDVGGWLRISFASDSSLVVDTPSKVRVPEYLTDRCLSLIVLGNTFHPPFRRSDRGELQSPLKVDTGTQIRRVRFNVSQWSGQVL